MLRNRFLIFVTVFICQNVVFGQNSFNNYTQEIPGSTLQFSMAAVAGGSYIMGSDKGDSDQKPAHKVTVSPFWIGTHEVTWDIYEVFLSKELEKVKNGTNVLPAGIDAVTRPTKPYLDMTFGMGKEGYPAVGMTHYNAIQFCKWLYTRTGIFYRLPTEAEWEFVAQADKNYDVNSESWHSGNSSSKTHQVGKKKANSLGVYDLFGNVAEWVYDQYDDNFYQGTKDSKDPVNVAVKLYPHVVRGGSYTSEVEDLTAQKRDFSDPMWKQLDPQIPKSNWWFPEAPFVGLRLVRPKNKPTDAEIKAYYDKAPIEDF